MTWGRSLRKLLALSVAAQAIAFPSTAAAASDIPAEDQQRLLDLTNSVLREEIDLERFYLQYRIVGTYDPAYRYYRYFALQNAGTSLSLSANLVNERDFGTHLHHPENISRRTARKALCAGMLGSLFDGSSSAIELATNTRLAVTHRMKHENPRWAVESVRERLKTIDAQEAEREAIIARLPDSAAASIYRAETNVLRTYRDWCLYEFATIYADVKSFQSANNIYYGLNVAANGCYLASFILGYKLFHHPQLGGRSAISAIIGDSLTIADVPAYHYGYDALYKFWTARLGRTMKQKFIEPRAEGKAAVETFTKLIANASSSDLASCPGAAVRRKIYDDWSLGYDDFVEKESVDVRHEYRVALQGNISGPAIGGTYLAQDIMGALSFYSTKKTHPSASESLAFAGSISALVGTSASLAMTNFFFINEQRHNRKLKKQHIYPEQLIQARFKTLDSFDSMLASNGRSAE
jgi:hypothetical protein